MYNLYHQLSSLLLLLIYHDDDIFMFEEILTSCDFIYAATHYDKQLLWKEIDNYLI